MPPAPRGSRATSPSASGAMAASIPVPAARRPRRAFATRRRGAVVTLTTRGAGICRRRPRRRAVGLVPALVLGLFLVLAAATPAAAHASLISVDPPDGARLDESPGTVTLTFSEPVSAELGGVRVLDADGTRVDEGAARVDGGVVAVDVSGDLADGTYVISYRVVSADGHPIRGGSVFGIGDVVVDDAALGRVAEGDDRLWEVVGGIGRGVAYAGVLVAAGGALFLLHAYRDGPRRSTLTQVVRIAATVGALGALVALPVQAALGTGQGPLSLFDDGVLGDVTAEGVGHSLLLVLVGLALLTIGLGRSTPMVVMGSLVAAGSFAATGHNRAGDTALLATLADVVHLVAAAVWAGGLVLLVLVLRLHRPGGTTVAVGADVADRDQASSAGAVWSAQDSGRVVARFSTLATGAIVGVGAAGLVLGWSEVRSLHALFDTSYGLFLIAKVAVVAAIGVMGMYNHFRLVPALEAGKTRAALVRLRSTVRFEVLALVAVAALTSVLVVLTPAKASVEDRVVERFLTVGGAGSVQVVVTPARVGPNTVHLYTYDADGRPADIAEAVTLELALPAAGVGPIAVEADRAGPAHLQVNTPDFAIAGDWELTIRARIDRFTEAVDTTTVTITP